MRHLALAKLRELRLQGLSFREIGRRYGVPRSTESGFHHPLPPERLLAPARIEDADKRDEDRATFARALDQLAEGMVFVDLDERPLHANLAIAEAVAKNPEGERLRKEIEHFAHALCALIELRGETDSEAVEEIAVLDVPTSRGRYRLRGSHIGLDLFGRGGSVLIVLQPMVEDSLEDSLLQERFGFSRQEARVAQLLAEGKSNQRIAEELCISPHTARRHTERVMQKLNVASRAEVAARLLRGD